MRVRRALLLLSLAACEVPTAPLPPDAVRFQPPAVYRQWWALTESCSGLRGNFDAIEWYVVPNTRTIPLGNGELVNARWDSYGNRIIIAGADDGPRAGDLIRHEMLHALVREGGHPRDMFIGRCGGVVVCITTCDAGSSAAPAPDAKAVVVDPSALDIRVEVTATPATPPDTEGYVMMVVSAHNPSSQPWQVRLPPSGDAGAPSSFSYQLVNTAGDLRYHDERADAPEVTRFAAGETKRFIFDFWSGTTPYDIKPGTWTFYGAYGSIGAPFAPRLTLAP